MNGSICRWIWASRYVDKTAMARLSLLLHCNLQRVGIVWNLTPRQVRFVVFDPLRLTCIFLKRHFFWDDSWTKRCVLSVVHCIYVQLHLSNITLSCVSYYIFDGIHLFCMVRFDRCLSPELPGTLSFDREELRWWQLGEWWRLHMSNWA